MKITYLRHSKVLFTWEAFYNSESFDQACCQYDLSAIKPKSKIEYSGEALYTSQLSRTENTLRSLIGNKEIIRLKELNEIPVRSFVDTKVVLPIFIWMLIGRVQWFFNHSRQPEGRRESGRRVNNFLDYLESKEQDCLIVGHGFYFVQMIEELKKRKVSGNLHKRLLNEEVRVLEASLKR